MINQFGDLTDQEFKEMMKMERPESVETLVEFDGEGDIPDSVDWRKVGAVTDVKNQELSNKGPIAATLDLSGLKFYHNGVLDSKHCNSTEDDLNHAILLVGYEKNCYIAKNSWRQNWALGGYFNILRDNNTCGISLFNSFPIFCESKTISSTTKLLTVLQIEHRKTYRSLSEDQKRFSIFKANIRSIEKHNERYARGEESFSMKINQFGDLTQEEFKERLILEKPEIDETLVEFDGEGDVPDSVDWSEAGAVTGAGAVEAQVFIRNKTLIPLSAQNLVSCAKRTYGNYGCAGGFQTEAFRYIKDHGILTDEEYPYRGRDGHCRKRGGVKISSYAVIPKGDEAALTQAIAIKGPIAATVDMSGFQFYHYGILDNAHCRSSAEYLNHVILIVGYKENYYIAKNSWGLGWGLGGYVNILRNNNTCGISLDNSYPIL
nr:unnamed protein product [Callosobruchus chinensis]